MAPVEVTEDYYAILEVSQMASATEIKKSYHRLAILRHPDKNQSKPDATAAFQLLNQAYETLKDEAARRLYDIQWPRITKTYRTAQEKAKQDAEAAKAETDKCAREKAAREAAEQKSRSAIELLTKRKSGFASEIFEVQRAINKLQAELKNIQTLEDKAVAEDQARNSWYNYAYSSVFGAAEEPETAKQDREMQRLQRRASKTIKETELARKEAKLKEWTDLLSGVEKAIAAELASSREREARAEREREEARRREMQRAWERQHAEFMERQRANRAAEEARAAQERAAAEALRRAAEERRKKEEEERRRVDARNAEIRRKLQERRQKENEERKKREAREEEERRQKEREEGKRRLRAEEERRRQLDEWLKNTRAAPKAAPSRETGPRTRAAGNQKATASSSAACQHRGWWDKVEHGSLQCENCTVPQTRFLFQCPDCQMKACAECRITLKNRGGKPRKQQPPRADHLRRQRAQYEESFAYDMYD